MHLRAVIAGLTLISSAAGAQTFGGYAVQLNGSGGNGTPLVTGGDVLRLMDDQYGSATSAFTLGTFDFSSSTAWSTAFTLHYAFTSADFAHGFGTGGDGIAFVVQSGDATALGTGGGYMGYAGIGHSLAVSFRSFNDDILVGADGDVGDAAPVVPRPAGIEILPGDDFFIHVALAFDGLDHVSIGYTDKLGNGIAAGSFLIDPSSIGSSVRLGFSAGSGAATQLGEVSDWTVDGLDFTAPPPVTATPEPATITLVGLGTFAMGIVARRRQRRLAA